MDNFGRPHEAITITNSTQPQTTVVEEQKRADPSTQTALLVNAKARRGQEWFDKAHECLRANGIPIHTAHALDDPSKLPDLLHACVEKGVKQIVVGGGDGSLRCAAGILAHTDVTLGVLPMGTVNDMARNLGIEPDVDKACQVIAAGYSERIHLGQANDDYFVITASLGFAAQSQTALKPELKKLFGPFGYLIAGLLTLRRLHKLQIHIRSHDKDESFGILQAGVVNGHSWMGGAFEIPGIDLESGRLAFYALPPQSFWSYLRIAHDLKERRFFHTPGLRAFVIDEINIETTSPQPLVLDGDLCGQTPVRLRIVPEALSVFVPAPDSKSV